MKKEKTLHEHAIVIENRMFIGAILLIIGRFLPTSLLFWLLWSGGFLLLISALIHYKKFYKCPHCSCNLPLKRAGYPNYCPDCGGKLDQTGTVQE